MQDGSGVQFLNSSKKFIATAVSMFSSEAFKKNPLLGRIVAFTNKAVTDYNQAIRSKLFPNNNTFARGELLMGYSAFGKENLFTGLTQIANGMDYVVQGVSKTTMQM